MLEEKAQRIDTTGKVSKTGSEETRSTPKTKTNTKSELFKI